MTDQELIKQLSDCLWEMWFNYQKLCIELAHKDGKRADDAYLYIPAEHKPVNRWMLDLQNWVTNQHMRSETNVPVPPKIQR